MHTYLFLHSVFYISISNLFLLIFKNALAKFIHIGCLWSFTYFHILLYKSNFKTMELKYFEFIIKIHVCMLWITCSFIFSRWILACQQGVWLVRTSGTLQRQTLNAKNDHTNGKKEISSWSLLVNYFYKEINVMLLPAFNSSLYL